MNPLELTTLVEEQSRADQLSPHESRESPLMKLANEFLAESASVNNNSKKIVDSAKARLVGSPYHLTNRDTQHSSQYNGRLKPLKDHKKSPLHGKRGKTTSNHRNGGQRASKTNNSPEMNEIIDYIVDTSREHQISVSSVERHMNPNQTIDSARS